MFSTDEVDSEKPISCGIFVQKHDSEPFEYTYKVSHRPRHDKQESTSHETSEADSRCLHNFPKSIMKSK